MKTKMQNTEAIKNGQERITAVTYEDDGMEIPLVRYEYRTSYGELFSTLAFSPDEARKERDYWMHSVAP